MSGDMKLFVGIAHLIHVKNKMIKWLESVGLANIKGRRNNWLEKLKI